MQRRPLAQFGISRSTSFVIFARLGVSYPAMHHADADAFNALQQRLMAAYGYCPSGRLFEAAAYGAPLLSDKNEMGWRSSSRAKKFCLSRTRREFWRHSRCRTRNWESWPARRELACWQSTRQTGAFPSGAVSEIVEDGRTGFLVCSTEEMAKAIGRSSEIDSAECRAVAASRFSIARTIEGYFSLYRPLAAGIKFQCARA